jgi:small GTP-binding protein
MEKITPEKRALVCIRKIVFSGETTLDISQHLLTSLPTEIGELNQLTTLDLHGNKLTSLPKQIGKLVNLTALFLEGNLLNELPEEIGELKKLEVLILGFKFVGNNLTNLPPEISQLSELKSLILPSNQLVTLPSEIGQLIKLIELDIYNNQLVVLPGEIGRLTNLAKLNLSKNNLTSLPSEINQLTNLVHLDLRHNLFQAFSLEISQLSSLSTLLLAGNQLTVLPAEIGLLTNLTRLDLADNQLTVLPAEIGLLTNLTTLNLANNKLTALPPEIGQLTNLTTLILSDNELLVLPSEIWQLKKLEWLQLSHNRISVLPARIGQLTNLTFLDLSSNQLTSLPAEIGQLIHLETLTLSNRDKLGKIVVSQGNKIEKLPIEIQNLKSLGMLDLRDNVPDFPPEILEKTYEPQAILNYFAWMLNGKRRAIGEIKCLIVGQGSVGKTSLVKRLTSGIFDPNETKTDGIAIDHWEVSCHSKTENQQAKIAINIWDFGGQEIMHATHQFFLTKRSLYLLVLDSRLTQEENRVEYWLKIIQSFGGMSPVLIVGNKADQHPLDIDRIGLRKKYSNIVGILETSAASGIGIEELKFAITEQVDKLPHVRDLLPITWFTVKTKLESVGQQQNFIAHDKYLELCTENDVTDEASQRILIGFLHDLGVILHFQGDPRLEELGILNPQWVTNGVYKILNAPSLFQNKGLLTHVMLDEILNQPEYPRHKRLFIVDMMKKFELCYDIETDKTFLIPDLLPKDEPPIDFGGIPVFEYLYPVLPSSVITRFIVRMSQHIRENGVWRSGVLLKIDQNYALVKADSEDRCIRIAIDGLERTRRDVLAAIRYQFNEIHSSIQGLNPQMRVPIPNAPNAEPIEYDYLLMLEREGDETYRVKDGNRLITINVRQILSGIESESQRKDRGNSVIIYGDVHTGGGDFTGHDKSISAGERGTVVGGSVSGNLVTGEKNQFIVDSYNKIVSAEIPPELKETLQQLAEAVSAMSQELPEEQAAEAVEDLSKLVDEATKPKPNKKWYSVSIDGLIKAAENLDKLGEPVISLSRKILSLLTVGLIK